MSSLSNIFPVKNVEPDNLNLRESLVQGLTRWYTNYRTRRQLARLPDFMLKDIGVSRVDAEQEASKVFWKN